MTEDELRDELLRAIVRADQFMPSDGSDDDNYDWNYTAEIMYGRSTDAVLPVVRRFADAQVAAERERIADTLEAGTVNIHSATYQDDASLASDSGFNAGIADAVRIARGQL